MHAISSYRGNRHRPPARPLQTHTHTHTHTHTGRTDNNTLSEQCNNTILQFTQAEQESAGNIVYKRLCLQARSQDLVSRGANICSGRPLGVGPPLP